MHHVYVLKSLKDEDLYVGRTEDLKQKSQRSQQGQGAQHEGSEAIEVHVLRDK